MSAERLDRLARGWRRRRMAGYAALVAGAAVFAGFGAGAALGWPPATRLGASFAAVVAVLLGAVLGRRGRRVDARAVARHLDRTVPALEESTELVLAGEETLLPLERLQRRRVAGVLDGLGEIRLPHATARRALATGVGLALAGAMLAALGPRMARVAAGAPASVAGSGRLAPAQPPRTRDVAIEIRPPAYTGRSPATVDGWEVDALEGSRVTWRIETDRAVAGAMLVTSSGDSVALAPDGAGRDSWTANLIATRSLLYRLVLFPAGDGAPSGGDYHRLTVRPDAPPTLTVVQPDERTTLAPGEPRTVPVLILADDDHGIADSRIVATVTSGSGENVKFREQVLRFARTERRGGHALALRATLDLAALGLAPGDELYFYAAARDNRAPTPNEARSETRFIKLLDTAQVALGELAGLPIDRLPAYFRSQRQIIIDTERLLAEQPRLARQTFRDRSNGIGIDQGLLRVRYGEFVGDEIAETEPEAGAGHAHDTEENATLLAQSVKTKLKAALAQMWEAELRLRTYRPREALPFEYRALELLKEVQQADRVYVQRTGFEPPPLEPDRKRLTGELKGIADRSDRRTLTRGPDQPAIRAALGLLDPAASLDAADRAALEAAGRELAGLALEEPGRHLEALQALRSLVDSLGRGAECRGCAAEVERGLLRALAVPAPAPTTREGARDGAVPAVVRRYRELLEAER